MPFPRSLAVAGILLSAAVVSAQQGDVFSTLGTTPDEAQGSIVGSLVTGTVAIVGQRSVFKTASADLRAALVRGVITAARAYTGTADFAERYAQFRESQRPEREALPQNADEAMAAQQKQIEEVIKQAQKMTENMPPEAREELEANVAAMKKQLAELNADPEHRASVEAYVKQSTREAEAEFARKDAEFATAYPPDPRRLIAMRLRAFLDLSATVDYSATVVDKDRKLRFADPEFEAKPREWKMMYRAGKPAVDAARAAAQEWLKALGM